MRIFRPNKYVNSLGKINFKKLRKRGYSGILFDIDNTLVPHGHGLTTEVKKFILSLKKMGYRIGLVSNNNEERVKLFNRELNLPYICKARKPLPHNYKKLAKKLGIKQGKVLFIGDQLFTDILGANLAGIKSILVKPIDSETEPLSIKIKRVLERILLKAVYE